MARTCPAKPLTFNGRGELELWMSITIIAEIGINHNGDVELAKQLIKMAKECGVDLVKFQKRTIDIVYTKDFLDSFRDSPWGKTQRAQKEGLEFGEQEYNEIHKYCKSIDIPWFASAWDIESLQFLDCYSLPHNKIASAMVKNLEFLEAVAERKTHTFISTGMATLRDIDEAVDIFSRNNCLYTLMHSVSTYPAKDEDCNVKIIRRLIERYGEPVGYSGHEVGLLPSLVAVVLGATVIERHITLDRASYGSDQAASLERRGLELLVKECKGISDCLGNGRKSIGDDERDVAKKLRYWENG